MVYLNYMSCKTGGKHSEYMWWDYPQGVQYNKDYQPTAWATP